MAYDAFHSAGPYGRGCQSRVVTFCGEAFGRFQASLVDIPDTLSESIPDFHNMEFRLRQLREAVAADAVGRVNEVRLLLDELESRAEEMCKAERLHREEVAQAYLPLRHEGQQYDV